MQQLTDEQVLDSMQNLHHKVKNRSATLTDKIYLVGIETLNDQFTIIRNYTYGLITESEMNNMLIVSITERMYIDGVAK